MSIDARDASAFYGTPLGELTAGQLRQTLLRIWPDCKNMAILGLGYTTPYLQLWREQSARTIAVSPSNQHLTPWPASSSAAPRRTLSPSRT